MIQHPIPLAQLHMPPVPRRQGGFTFIWLLFLVAGLGVGMAAIGTLWHSAALREKEAELLFVGDQYRRAIESFSQIAPPDGQKRLPKTLEELLLDPRFQHTVRHLRRAYADPMTGKAEWGVVKDGQGGIVGVHSLSSNTPIKTANFPARYADFAGQGSYRDWIFKSGQGADVAAAAVKLPEETSDSTPTGTTDTQAKTGVQVDPALRAACAQRFTLEHAKCKAYAEDVYRDERYGLCRSAAQRGYNECLGLSVVGM